MNQIARCMHTIQPLYESERQCKNLGSIKGYCRIHYPLSEAGKEDQAKRVIIRREQYISSAEAEAVGRFLRATNLEFFCELLGKSSSVIEKVNQQTEFRRIDLLSKFEASLTSA